MFLFMPFRDGHFDHLKDCPIVDHILTVLNVH